jgi:ubiquitin C-terminal hydrolase
MPVDEEEQETQRYYLKGIIVHLGTGLNYGHYISVVRVMGRWVRFDDEKIDEVDDRYLKFIYGSPNEAYSSSPCAYILVYEREDIFQ